MAREVQVISGSRGTDTVAPAMQTVPKAAMLAPREAGAKVYVSRGRNVIVNIRMDKPRYDDGGRQVSFPSVKAAFQNGRYETKDPVVIERLEACKGFGLGKDFWLLEDERREAARMTAETFAKNLESLDLTQIPEALLNKLRAGLGATVRPDFDPKA